ncbi:hypothetical protein JHK85_012348 [Glycine max]|nr:hypothetical protein JHK85_012348 [Glycine max]
MALDLGHESCLFVPKPCLFFLSPLQPHHTSSSLHCPEPSYVTNHRAISSLTILPRLSEKINMMVLICGCGYLMVVSMLMIFDRHPYAVTCGYEMAGRLLEEKMTGKGLRVCQKVTIDRLIDLKKIDNEATLRVEKSKTKFVSLPPMVYC